MGQVNCKVKGALATKGGQKSSEGVLATESSVTACTRAAGVLTSAHGWLVSPTWAHGWWANGWFGPRDGYFGALVGLDRRLVQTKGWFGAMVVV